MHSSSSVKIRDVQHYPDISSGPGMPFRVWNFKRKLPKEVRQGEDPEVLDQEAVRQSIEKIQASIRGKGLMPDLWTKDNLWVSPSGKLKLVDPGRRVQLVTDEEFYERVPREWDEFQRTLRDNIARLNIMSVPNTEGRELRALRYMVPSGFLDRETELPAGDQSLRVLDQLDELTGATRDSKFYAPYHDALHHNLRRWSEVCGQRIRYREAPMSMRGVVRATLIRAHNGMVFVSFDNVVEVSA